LRNIYNKYLRTTFTDEEQEKKFQETFHIEGLKNMGRVTICTLVTATINLYMFIRLAFKSPYQQMPVVYNESVNSIIVNCVWIAYSIASYLLHRNGFHKCNWIYGLIHYIILIVQYSTYKFDYVKYIREYMREGKYSINEYNLSAEEFDYELEGYLP
jgi:hypothetical protein